MSAPYARLGVAIATSTVVMFLLTYALLATVDHFYANLNRAYMAVLMAAPMAVVMIVVMGHMYADRRRNAAIVGASAAAFVVVLALMRTQWPIADAQFLRSMIPHHSSAIVMCERARLEDPRIVALCRDIVDTQRREIALMRELLRSR